MRNLDECKAEIFRRSNEKIKERKRIRNRVLTWCIPAVLCIAVWSVTILPTMITPRKDTAPETTDVLTEDKHTMDNAVYPYVEVEIRDISEGAAYYRRITDSMEATQVFNRIQNFYGADNVAPEVNENVVQDNVPDEQDMQASSKQNGYTVIFSTAEGESITYILVGNELRNTATGQRLILTDAQALELKEALGLPE